MFTKTKENFINTTGSSTHKQIVIPTQHVLQTPKVIISTQHVVLLKTGRSTKTTISSLSMVLPTQKAGSTNIPWETLNTQKLKWKNISCASMLYFIYSLLSPNYKSAGLPFS